MDDALGKFLSSSEYMAMRERIATAVLAAINVRSSIGQLDYDPYVDAVFQADMLIAELYKEKTYG